MKSILKKIYCIVTYFAIILFLIISCSMQRKSTIMEEGNASTKIEEGNASTKIEEGNASTKIEKAKVSIKKEEGEASVRIGESMVEKVVEDEDNFDEMPTPIGGDTYVLMKMKEKLRNLYYIFVGNRMQFSVDINKKGEVEQTYIMYVPFDYLHAREKQDAIKKMEETMRHIRFTPAIKNGKKVKAKFIYNIWL